MTRKTKPTRRDDEMDKLREAVAVIAMRPCVRVSEGFFATCQELHILMAKMCLPCLCRWIAIERKLP